MLLTSIRRATSLIAIGAFLMVRSLSGQTPAAVPAERLAARKWFRDAKFGMFIHWGVFSQLGNGEWVMQNRGIRVPEYEWMAAQFNPVRFDAVKALSRVPVSSRKSIDDVGIRLTR